jgi:hypothetical protein
MFESVQIQNGEPVEFTHGGRRFRIHAVQSRWRESGGWWKRIGNGVEGFADNQKTIWHVEAAPIGTVNVFEIQFDELNNSWSICPTSKVR